MAFRKRNLLWQVIVFLVCVDKVHLKSVDPDKVGRTHPEFQNNDLIHQPVATFPSGPNNQPIQGSWMDTAKTMMQGPAGQVVVNIAKEVISRSVGGTQVLSLNLTNLLILLFLKAIIFAAGLIGAGSWNQYARGRSLITNDSPLFEYGDATLMLGFLAGEGSGEEGCLYRAACEYPKAAVEYFRAGQVTLQGSDIFNMSVNRSHYNLLLQNVKKAAKEGLENAPCDLIYNCPL